jgi:electron transfer flavoprotein beta subunit
MNIAVLIKLVPDLVEELEIAEDGKALDKTYMRMIINEPDEHAVEQAILLKERAEGAVTVLGPDVDDMANVLFTSSARGADRIVKLVGDFGMDVNNHALARAFASALGDLSPDLILTGVQAHNDLDGSLGPLVAEQMGLPYVGYISAVATDGSKLTVQKEYPGGLIAEMEIETPAVLGIQSSEQPPRYVAVSKVRQAMKTGTIDEQSAGDLDPSGGPNIARMLQPEAGKRAEMIEGEIDEIAERIIELLAELGVR